MSKYAVTTGIQNAPVKTVLYGPEGIGKSTFASYFPDPVFIDTEGGTKRLNVKRLPQPTSWAMLLDEVAEVRKGSIPCGTLVIDTADWAERLAIDAVCAKAKVDGLEGFGYGKGYTYLKEALSSCWPLRRPVGSVTVRVLFLPLRSTTTPLESLTLRWAGATAPSRWAASGRKRSPPRAHARASRTLVLP